MNQASLFRWLRWFHALEANQVALYRMQAALACTNTDRRMLRRVADIEQRHVDNILDVLQRRGGTPAPLMAPAAPVAGAALGAISGFSARTAYYTNIRLENMAMSHYKRFISLVENDNELRRLLWDNCMDESLHAEWFKARLRNDIDKLAPA